MRAKMHGMKTRRMGGGEVRQPVVIDPNAVLTRKQVEVLLDLAPSTIRREIREGRLPDRRVSGRQVFVGRTILEWLMGKTATTSTG